MERHPADYRPGDEFAAGSPFNDFEDTPEQAIADAISELEQAYGLLRNLDLCPDHNRARVIKTIKQTLADAALALQSAQEELQ